MRIICPACGLSSVVSADHADEFANCPHCGKRFRLTSHQDQLPELPSEEDELGFAAQSYTPPPAMKPIRRANPPRDPRLIYMAGICGLLAIALLGVLAVVVQKAMAPAHVPPPLVVVQPPPPTTQAQVPWDRAHRADLLAMKDQAEALALDGKLHEAYEAYRQIIVTVGDHDLTDPVAVQIVAGARAGQDRVLAAMMTPPPGSSAPAAPTAPAPAVAASTTTQPTTEPLTTASAATQPTTGPAVAQLDPAEQAADGAAPLPGNHPPPGLHAYTLPDAVTDAQIGDAITNGVKYLEGQFRNGEITTLAAAPQQGNRPGPGPAAGAGQRRPRPGPPSNLDHSSDLGDLPGLGQPLPGGPGIGPGPAFTAPWDSAYSQPGVDALCVYALLHAGQAMDQKILGEHDPFTDQILNALKHYNLVFTYHRSLRAAALAVYNRTQDTASLEDDVRWLLAASHKGAYTYVIPQNANDDVWDNSNSQYGLLGVWSGAMAGKPVPQEYWRSVEGHWNMCANSDGTFGYTLGTSSTTMTCAGVASLLVARDYLETPDIVGKTGNKASSNPAIDNGLNWLDAGDNCMSAWGNIGGTGYALYGLERVGLASGFKYFGSHDWYSELAKRLVSEQHFDGSWGSTPTINGNVDKQTLVDTAYALLFLARGRHPILFNKLRYDGDWNNRAHDVSHLARYASGVLERPLNWQVVNLHRNWFDWMDSPVLYIAGDKKPDFTAQDYDAIRSFSNAGGLIFTHADNGSAEFTRWVVELNRTVFPRYELMQVPREHPLYSTVYKLKDPPPLLSISNGSRLLLIHSPTDLSGGWQLNWTDEKKMAFQLGVNLFVYAAGKGNLKNRLASSYIPEDPDRPDSTRQIARLQYAAEWDPEPYAWARFRRYFQWETHSAIDPVVVQLKDLTPGSVPIATLTGTVRHDFTDAEQQAARAYVQAGGVLVIDACGGQADFINCVEKTLLPQAFPGAIPTPINPAHPLLLPSRLHADDLTHALLRGYANETGGKDLPLETIQFGKGWVIYSRLDLTTGLLGTQSWGIKGYDPVYAQSLMKNAVLWAEARSPAPAVKP